MIYAAVIGFGTVGSGVVDIIEQNQEQIRRAVPEGIYVKYILDIRDFPDSPYADRVVHDIETVVNDPEISIICETMGGKEPARTFSQMALEKGISVCTSNKELVAAFGPSLIRTAREHNCSYFFEASVGGGIPLIRPLLDCLAQEDVTSITGILNGTTNYILTKMDRDGEEYAPMLREAQKLGYAERNPDADVEGHDAGRKIAILSSLMCGKNVPYESIYVEGISGITAEDFLYAGAMGCSIRLLGVCRKTPDGLSVLTAPFLVKEGHPLYAVSDVFNGVVIHGNMVDDVMFYGRGAGKLPTGSAVVGDMITAAREKEAGHFTPVLWSEEAEPMQSFEKHACPFLVRISAGLKEKAKTAFSGHIEKILELKEHPQEFAVLTDIMTEKEFREAAESLEIHGRIRVLTQE